MFQRFVFQIKRVFYLLPFFAFLLATAFAQAQDGKQAFQVCAGCHSIGEGQRVGPDLKGVNDRYEEAWLIQFIQSSQSMIKAGDEQAVKTFEACNKIPMPDFELNEQQVKGLLAYIKNYKPEAVAEAVVQADPNFLENDFNNQVASTYWLSIISAIVLLLIIVDLLFTKVIKMYFIHIILAMVAVFILSEAVYTDAQAIGLTTGYEPDQPIKFSHKIHAGDNKIDCQYCHIGASESRHSSIPSASLCLNCHNVIKEGINTGKEEIAKIHEAVRSGKPIEWVKVHNLPDHVYFNHSQHVTVAKLDCEACHGDVANMGRIQQVNNLSMGWCLDCHRKSAVQFDNPYYTETYRTLHEKMKSGEIKKVTVEDIGGADCQRCHY